MVQVTLVSGVCVCVGALVSTDMNWEVERGVGGGGGRRERVKEMKHLQIALINTLGLQVHLYMKVEEKR